MDSRPKTLLGYPIIWKDESDMKNNYEVTVDITGVTDLEKAFIKATRAIEEFKKVYNSLSWWQRLFIRWCKK